jgi:NADH-quinone oxidoreductase subunit G
MAISPEPGMPEIFIDGQKLQAGSDQTVMEVAVANGIVIPYFCWHPELSVAGNCRICAVQVEGRSWVEIACNMPVTDGLRVLTNSANVNEYRKAMMQLVTLNHPVDCGICDKAGECKLQDYHYQYNGSPSVSRDAKTRATKLYPLSDRIVLDNERCILCSKTRASTTTPTPTTSSTSAPSAPSFRALSCTRRACGI